MATSSAHLEGLGETLIPAINRLQDIFSQVTLDFRLELPQVAVIGSQSSGKSSVLEALVGRDFLPRGPEICTRRPLVLQLVKSSSAGSDWGEFLHLPGKRFYDFEQMRQEILQETERITGANKGISDKAIRLKISSPHVLTMTLVDLPGIAKVPVGDQPSDIEARIRNMVLEYIRHPTCVILAVSAANHDLVNSDAIELARSVDPEGLRTIGVLTKLDIMDRGTNALRVLKNEVVPLRLGYIGVVNRSQEDIISRRNIGEARAAELDFFSAHPEYSSVTAHCGLHNLAKALNHILVEHIRALLPSLKASIEEMLDKRFHELKLYGDPLNGQSAGTSGALLLRLLDAYAVRYGEMLDGRSEQLPTSELAGGARIRHIFQDIFVEGVGELNPSSELTDEDVRTAIRNSGGVKGSLLIPEAPFELLVRRAISRLLPSALQCQQFVHAELLRIASQCAPADVSRFPNLQVRLRAAVEDFISEGAAPAERMIRDLVDCEHAYINTDHPQFIGGNRALSQVLAQLHGIPAEEDEQDEQQEDAQGTAGSQEHRRPRSAGHPTEPSSSTSTHKIGRPPLAETTANNKLGLKGVEPELFSPEELLGGARRASPSTSRPAFGSQTPPQHQPALHRSDSESSDRQQSGSWFQLPWKVSQQDEAPQSRRISRDDRGLPLNQPPLILRVPGGVSEQEEVQVQVTRLLVESYFDVVRKNLQDAVPKAVMHFLVNSVQRGLQQHLIRTLYREEQFADIMSEREDIATKRTQCQNAVRALREALTALEALPSSLMQRLQAQHAESSSTSDRAITSTPASTSSRMPSNDYDAALISASPQYARGRRGPYNPRAMSQAAKMASDAMSAVSVSDEVDIRRAESLANPFCYES